LDIKVKAIEFHFNIKGDISNFLIDNDKKCSSIVRQTEESRYYFR